MSACTRTLAATASVLVAAFAVPALAEPRQPHQPAGREVLPTPTGQLAVPWSRGDYRAGRAASWGPIQPAPQEMVLPLPDDAFQPTPLGMVPKSVLPCDAPCGCLRPRRIEYRDHRRPPRKGDCLCAPPIPTALVVPAGLGCQCAVEIPVCLPACCTASPQVEARRGLLGRTRVLYRWCCGLEVELVFCGNGDLIVHFDQR